MRQGLNFGFGTPEQAFRSWRTAVQGELLVEEYKSLSEPLKARYGGLSLLEYSEGREELAEELGVPLSVLRWGLYRAKEPEIVARGPQVAILQSRVPGPLWFKDRWLVVRMIRHGFYDVWLDQDPLRPAFGRNLENPLETRNLIAQKDLSSGREYIYASAQVPLDPDLVPEGVKFPDDVQRIEAGWEWKIDDFNILDAPLDPEDLLVGTTLDPLGR